MKELINLGNIYGEKFGTGYAGNVWDKKGICPTLLCMQGGGRQPMIIVGSRGKQRIRKLTPLECWRLMDFSEDDFRKAESVNSNTQLYKQAGNSIVKNVLIAVFGQMIPGKEKAYEISNEKENGQATI